MSEHFTNKQKAEERTDWRRFINRNYQPTTQGEIRFLRHAKFRAGLFFVYLFGFIYMNPEYSYTATWIQTKYRERNERIADEERQRVTPSKHSSSDDAVGRKMP
ncbi:transmembrane protein, putative [Bodo saltans]|uniref:Transmembrane protein, putative n=1 Tax=Bodo saltans TaxID=75058 RepID=A0A0S4JU07_BODSA|nr:transmembrane protein, putative [Bodo saltans]|eukprot:CUG93771.1 transmembrane protein, putative [Bodo saltans]